MKPEMSESVFYNLILYSSFKRKTDPNVCEEYDAYCQTLTEIISFILWENELHIWQANIISVVMALEYTNNNNNNTQVY
jgi:hypothetical protein